MPGQDGSDALKLELRDWVRKEIGPFAALAGLPKSAVQQARRRLAELEQRGRETHASEMAPQALDAPQQFGLFAPAPSASLEALAAIDPDELTPKQALEALYRLKSLL